MFRVIAVIATIFVSVVLLIVSSKQSEVKILRVGHTLDSQHPVHKALVHLQNQLHMYSDGAMQIKIYANGQLGSERELVELLQIGSLAITKVSAATLEGFVEDMKLFGVPYIFKDRSHRFSILEGEVGKQVLGALEKAHMHGLGYFDAGSRSFYTCSDMVESPDDITGKKIRVMNSRNAVNMIAAFGGAATPISWGELYAALQQGVVDGAENNPPSYFLSRHYEICKNYSLNEHTSVPDVVVASKHIFDSLTSQQRAWLERSMSDAVELQKKLWMESEEHALHEIQQKGVVVSRPEKKPFMEASLLIHQSFKNTLVGDYIKKIKAL